MFVEGEGKVKEEKSFSKIKPPFIAHRITHIQTHKHIHIYIRTRTCTRTAHKWITHTHDTRKIHTERHMYKKRKRVNTAYIYHAHVYNSIPQTNTNTNTLFGFIASDLLNFNISFTQHVPDSMVACLVDSKVKK